jgi:hypothetical protein
MAVIKTLFVGADSDGYPAWSDRQAMGFGMSQGVLPSSRIDDGRAACQVVQRSGTANWSVDIGPGWVLVDGTDENFQGTYAGLNSATLNLPNPTGPPATLPRVDMVVARVVDSEHASGATEDRLYFEWIAGTPTSGANLTNKSGAPSIPDTAYVLAYLLTSPSDSVIVNSMLEDRRYIAGPLVFGADGKRYRIGVNASGQLGLDDLSL